MIKSTLFRLALFLLLGFSAANVYAAENQFFVFPIKEIEGLGINTSSAVRPLVDRNAIDFITGNQSDAQKEVLSHFSSQLSQAYAGSIVHVKQVRDSFKGPVVFDDNDNLNCGDSSTVPLEQTYAAVIGISRASFYKVERGLNTEILIPITLNLQIIKVDKAKILFSSSNTTYSQFLVSTTQIGTSEYTKLIKEAITKNLKDQITSLVQEAKANFTPKLTAVKIVGKEDNFYVADKGFEVGFNEGDLPEAKDVNGKVVWFRVLTAGNGYSVLERLDGDIKIGQDYQFMFESKADDSNKPRVMPVSTFDKNKAMANGVIDVFTKSIGYKAPFQIAAVDVNFQQTMANIRSRAQCVPSWEKYPLSSQIKESRTDFPQFILNVDTGETAVFTAKGDGAVKTKETFATVVQANISDLNGLIYGSAIGVDKYVLDKSAGIGLSTANAKEVSYQNSTRAMVADFLKNINFDPKVYKVKNVNPNSLLVENIPVESGYQINASVLRKLAIKVSARDVFVKLPLLAKGKVIKKGADVEVPFEMQDVGKDYFKPKAGDSLIVYALPKGNVPSVGICDGEFIGKNNAVTTSFAKPLLRNFIYNLPNYQVVSATPETVKDVNYLLDAGNFKSIGAMNPRSDMLSCLQPGYLIREDQATCAEDSCKATTTSALLIRRVESTQPPKDYIVARKTQLQGFDAPQKENLYSVNAHEQFLAEIPELAKKVSEK